MSAFSGSGGIAPPILNLVPRWRLLVSHVPPLLYPGNDPILFEKEAGWAPDGVWI
jgi:hypothetical protein